MPDPREAAVRDSIAAWAEAGFTLVRIESPIEVESTPDYARNAYDFTMSQTVRFALRHDECGTLLGLRDAIGHTCPTHH